MGFPLRTSASSAVNAFSLAAVARLAMPWSEDRYPPAMAHLPPVVRAKAVEIANALLQEGHDEGFCIRVAIARAHEWARRRGLE